MRRVDVLTLLGLSLFGACVFPGRPDRLSDFRRGVINIEVQHFPAEGEAIGDGLKVLVTIYDDDDSYCQEVRSDVDLFLDGEPMRLLGRGEPQRDLVDGLTCGLPSWVYAGDYAPDRATSEILVTDGTVDYRFEVEGLLHRPTLTLEGTDPVAWAPDTEVVVTFGPESLPIDDVNGFALAHEPTVPLGGPQYRYCIDPGCIEPTQRDGNRWTLRTPDFCRPGRYELWGPTQSVRATCPPVFEACQEDPVVGFTSYPIGAVRFVDVADDGLRPPCEATLEVLAADGFTPGPVSLAELVVAAPPEGTSVYVHDPSDVGNGAVRVDLPAEAPLPRMGEGLSFTGDYDRVTDGEGMARRVEVADASDVTNLGPFVDYDLQAARGITDWNLPDLNEGYGELWAKQGTVLARTERGLLFEDVNGNEVPYEGPWYDPRGQALVEVGERLRFTGIVRIDGGRFVLSPRWANDIAPRAGLGGDAL